MSSNMTRQPPKPGVSPRKTTGEPSKQRTALLKDNSWIRQTEEDDPVDVDTNYGRGDLDGSKTQADSESGVLGNSSQVDPVSPSTSVGSLVKRFGATQQTNESRNSTTTKSSVPTATRPASTVPSKPPVAPKKPVPTTPSKGFTARVFSGANSSKKANATLSPKPSITPVTSLITGSETASSKAPSTAVTTSRSTTTTFTSSEKTLPSPVTKTETYSKSWGPSNDNTELKTTTITTVTTLNSANDNKKTPSNTQDSFYDSPFSPGVYISPVSQKSSPPNILSYRSSQSKYDAGTESETASSELRSSTVSSTRSTTTTFTSSEKTLPSPVTKTETYSKSWGPSNDNTELKTMTITTATTLNSANDNKKTPSNTQDSFDDNLFSPGVYISPVSEQSSPPNILSYRSSQSKYDAGMTLRQTPTLSPTMYSSAATPSLSQATTTRTVSKRDLCTVCGKCITGEGRMILEDLQIFSHSSCFKCELCRISLGALEAGDSLWVYKGMVHCDNCYKKTKAQWFR